MSLPYQCTGCGERFGTASARDRHRVSSRLIDHTWCLSDFGMEEIGMFYGWEGKERVWYSSMTALPGHPGAAESDSTV